MNLKRNTLSESRQKVYILYDSFYVKSRKCKYSAVTESWPWFCLGTGVRAYVEEGGRTKGHEDMSLSDGYSPNLVVVVVSRECTYTIDTSKLMCAVCCLTTTPQ